MKLDLNLLQIFDAVYEAGGITPAARKLGLTQPAVSNALKRLRDHLDDPLFERVGNRFVPTEEATRLAPIIHEALLSIDKGIAAVEPFDPAKSTRNFSIVVPDAAEPLILNRLLQQTMDQSPGITYDVKPLWGIDFDQELLDKNIDMGLSVFAQHADKLRTAYLIDDEACIVVRADHPVYGDRDEFTLEDMEKVGLITIAPQLRALTHLEHELQARNVKRRFIAIVSRLWSIPYIVATTDLAGALSRRMAETFADRMGLKIFSLPLDRPMHQWYLVWHEDHDDDPAHTWLRTQILSIFAKTKAADTK
ncbi:LysR family transcriptional regulator [Pyruvatibacter sp.]|uniref:LysR family transcriptional regulator n=1 Tax=Pyruvatibacter sp. TaxID=1981328 RepID=UPI0032ED56E1